MSPSRHGTPFVIVSSLSTSQDCTRFVEESPTSSQARIEEGLRGAFPTLTHTTPTQLLNYFLGIDSGKGGV